MMSLSFLRNNMSSGDVVLLFRSSEAALAWAAAIDNGKVYKEALRPDCVGIELIAPDGYVLRAYPARYFDPESQFQWSVIIKCEPKG